MTGHILEYYVMRSDGAHTMWLSEANVWTNRFHMGAAFQTEQAANTAAKAVLSDEQVYYVMACMGSE